MGARYLFSSIQQIERIESLFDLIGYPPHNVIDRHRSLATRASVVEPAVPHLNAWLRRLTKPEANRVIEQLEIEHEQRAQSAPLNAKEPM